MVGFIISSLLFINFNIIRFADFGPNPGNLDIAFINSSISLISIIAYNGHLNPGIPKPPVTLESSSEVLDLRLFFALL